MHASSEDVVGLGHAQVLVRRHGGRQTVIPRRPSQLLQRIDHYAHQLNIQVLKPAPVLFQIHDLVQARRSHHPFVEEDKNVVTALVIGERELFAGDGGEGEGRRRLVQVLRRACVAPHSCQQPDDRPRDGRRQESGQRHAKPCSPASPPGALSPEFLPHFVLYATLNLIVMVCWPWPGSLVCNSTSITSFIARVPSGTLRLKTRFPFSPGATRGTSTEKASTPQPQAVSGAGRALTIATVRGASPSFRNSPSRC